MKTRIALVTVGLLALLAASAVAADISGKWVAQIPGRDGATMEQTFVFKVEGSKVTGTVSTPRGEQEISEGKIEGDNLSFVTVRQMGEFEMKTSYKGKVSGDEIKFTRQMVMPEGGFPGGPGPGAAPGGGQGRGPGGPTEFVAKRVK